MEATSLQLRAIIVVQHASDGSIAIEPTAAARRAGAVLLGIGNLPAVFPIILLVVYRDTANWVAVAVLLGAAVAWLVLMTLLQSLNQPWTIHADSTRLWMTRRISGRQLILRSDLRAIREGSTRYVYRYTSETKPAYFFLNRQGGIAASIKAEDYARTDVEELAQHLGMAITGDPYVDIQQQLKRPAS